MKKFGSLVKKSLFLLIPILLLTLYFTFGGSSESKVQDKYELEEFVCGIEEDVPENKVIIEFLEENYQKVVDQKDGNIPMSTFRDRVGYVVNYNPGISEYLKTDSYRYKLDPEIKNKVLELVDEKSYSNTVNNIHNWVLDNIEYTYSQNWYTAQSTWKEKSANCNGISFLTCGMMRESGIPCMVVANDEHAWTEYLYLDDQGRIIWYVWDQGLEGYPALSENTYENYLE
ncbi:MAG: hypothetical protein GF368_01620 [Candidatus Aenigmarchaeota archaeon]|nr:hypothetical protein [Candidatus Aenigmarchaeota archaeon]